MSTSIKAKYVKPSVSTVGAFQKVTQHAGSGKRFDQTFTGQAGQPVTNIFS